MNLVVLWIVPLAGRYPMKLNTLLSIYAVVALGFCVGLLLVPAFWITLYGAKVDAQATVLLRLTGALFGGIGVMAWTGRDAEPSISRHAMVRGLGGCQCSCCFGSSGRRALRRI